MIQEKYGMSSMAQKQSDTVPQKIWEIVPEHIKNCKSLNEFKNKIKTWIPDKCSCSKTYVAGVGFID